MLLKEELLPNLVLIRREKQEVPEKSKYSYQLQLNDNCCGFFYSSSAYTSIAAALLISSVHSNRCCCFTMRKIFAEVTRKVVVKHVDNSQLKKSTIQSLSNF